MTQAFAKELDAASSERWGALRRGFAMPAQTWWKNGVIYQIYPWSLQDSNGDGIGDLAGSAAGSTTSSTSAWMQSGSHRSTLADGR